MQRMLVLLFSFSMCLFSGCSDNDPVNVAGTSPLEEVNIPTGITISQVATGFTLPLQITNAGDGTNRLFIVEKSGRIKIISNGVVLPTPFLNISGLVSGGSEQGLLGITFPPNYTNKRYFYANYTNKIGVGNTIVARFPLTADPNIANSADPTQILQIAQPFDNHNGGQLAFGPDGYLYIGTGDGGGDGDPLNNAQNTASLLGKILRIDVEAGIVPYSIPATNPFNNEVWSYGLRNPWKFSFDSTTGEIYIADVGQNMIEEVNVQASATPSLNYGWPIMEGSKCFSDPSCNTSGLIIPTTEYDHSNGDCTVIGGHMYRGNAYPRLRGVYVYGDFCSGKIRGLKKVGINWESQVLLDTTFNISSFGEDEAGNIYFSDFTSGTIYKIEAL